MKNKFLADKNLIDSSNALSSVASMIGDKDVINLSIGDPDFITNKIIIDEAFSDAEKGHTKYTLPSGDPELNKEIIGFYKEEYGLTIDKKEIMVTVGACHALFIAFQACLNQGDEVIVPEPYFSPYKDEIEMAGGKLIPLPTFEKDEFVINIDSLKTLITPKTRAILINSPNNPTGACYSRATLQALADVAIEHDLIVLSDEVYDAISFKSKHISILEIEGMKERSILLASFSKGYAMTGWRIGFAIAPDYVIKCMVRINESITFSAPSISQRAAIHAIRNRSAVQPAIIHGFEKRMNYGFKRINAIQGLSVLEPRGGIYLFMNIKETGMSSNEFSKYLLAKTKIVVLTGTAFGESGEGFVRIACTISVEKMKEAFDRVEELFGLKMNHPQ